MRRVVHNINTLALKVLREASLDTPKKDYPHFDHASFVMGVRSLQMEFLRAMETKTLSYRRDFKLEQFSFRERLKFLLTSELEGLTNEVN